MRRIAHPQEPLKNCLSIINSTVLSPMFEDLLNLYNCADIASAYRPQWNVKRNAQIHAENKCWVKFDFSHFYDTVRLSDTWKVITDSGLYDTSGVDLCVWKDATIDPDTGGLTQGSPTSGTMAGIALIPFWVHLRDLLREHPLIPDDTVFTQYSDDLCISSNSDLKLNVLTELVISAIKKSGLKVRLNTDKTSIRYNHRRRVTGVSCNDKNELTVRRKSVRNIRALLHAISKDTREEAVMKICEDFGLPPSTVLGQLSFMRYVDQSGKIAKIMEAYEPEIDILRTLSKRSSCSTNHNVLS